MSHLRKIINNKDSLVYITIFFIYLISVFAGLADFDYYWQVALGRNIVTKGDFNSVYNLVWGTNGVSEYLDHEWLTNVFFYLMSLLGYRYIAITKLVISAFCGICTILYIKNENKDLNTVSIIGLFVYTFMISTVFIKVKAYSISLGFVLIEIILLKKYNRVKSLIGYEYSAVHYMKNKDKEPILYFISLLVLCIIWNNMHSGSIPLFFGIAGLYW